MQETDPKEHVMAEPGTGKGLTKREYFAAKVMQAMIGDGIEEYSGQAYDLACDAVRQANALIDALNDESIGAEHY